MAGPCLSLLLSWILVGVCLIPFNSARLLKRMPQTSSGSSIDLSTYTVPVSNGVSSLPSPTDLTLKAITLGRGTQNYTCTNTAAEPMANGATATLFDASPLVGKLPAADGEAILNMLPAYLICYSYESIENSSLSVLGHHYFDTEHDPVFDLGSSGFLKGVKTGYIMAPTTASPGPDGFGDGAVDWLQLTAKLGSTDLKEVYRVETAGGKPPASCEGQPESFEVQYAAQYWFYA